MPLRRFEPRPQVINDHPYRVIPPAQDEIASAAVAGLGSAEEMQRLGDVRALVGQLYEALNVEEHQAQQGRKWRLFRKQKRRYVLQPDCIRLICRFIFSKQRRIFYHRSND